jgi:hypothetical protein
VHRVDAVEERVCSRVASAALWQRSTVLAQACGVFGVGVEPPPDSRAARCQVVIGWRRVDVVALGLRCLTGLLLRRHSGGEVGDPL